MKKLHRPVGEKSRSDSSAISRQDQSPSLTDRSYWEGIWESAKLPRGVNPLDCSIRNRGNMAFHRFFSSALRSMPLQNASLVEVGCAQSKWLPYFWKEHGLSVTGLDYSPLGCARALALMKRDGCPGKVVQADMFDPPGDLRSRFDVVLSMGLVEHFTDTASAIGACAALAKPGGIVITTIPNLSGFLGWVQRLVDRRIYEKHVPLDCKALRAAHERCGLLVLQSGYLQAANFAVVNSVEKTGISAGLIRGLLLFVTAAIWAFEWAFGRLPETQIFSPYATCVARKGGASS